MEIKRRKRKKIGKGPIFPPSQWPATSPRLPRGRPSRCPRAPQQKPFPSAAAHPGPTRQLWTQLPSLSSPTSPLLPHDARASSPFFSDSLKTVCAQQPHPLPLPSRTAATYALSPLCVVSPWLEEPPRHPPRVARGAAPSSPSSLRAAPLFFMRR